MIQIRRSAIVRHSPPQMFDLVNDVEAYPRRFAWCAGAQVRAHDTQSLTARLDLRLGGMTQSFTTRNTLDPPQGILMQLVEGPFRTLDGAWSFYCARRRRLQGRIRAGFRLLGIDGPGIAHGISKAGRSHGR